MRISSSCPAIPTKPGVNPGTPHLTTTDPVWSEFPEVPSSWAEETTKITRRSTGFSWPPTSWIEPPLPTLSTKSLFIKRATGFPSSRRPGPNLTTGEWEATLAGKPTFRSFSSTGLTPKRTRNGPKNGYPPRRSGNERPEDWMAGPSPGESKPIQTEETLNEPTKGR